MNYLKYFLFIFILVPAADVFAQQPFQAGNIVVCRLGDGSVTLNSNATAVFLDEYTETGTLVQTIALPTAAAGSNLPITLTPTDFGTGALNLSSNGKYIVVAGRNTPVGTNTASTATAIALIDFNGTVNTSNFITDFTEASNAPWTAATDNGTRFWLGGAGGIRYAAAGNTTSTLILASTGQVRNIALADGQMYAGASPSPKLFKIGTGLPTTAGQTLTGLPGLPLNIQGPGQCAFADLDPNTPGVDVLYVASPQTSVSAAVGLRKFSLVGGSWVDNGTIGNVANTYYYGLTLKQNGNNVTLFATRQGLNNSVKGGELISLADNSGYNATISGTPVVLAAATTANTLAFRGVALVPQPAPFTAGNIVTCRVGDGTATSNFNAARVFIEEFNTDGQLVQTIQMPTIATGSNNPLTLVLSDFATGMINLSVDGKKLMIAGRNTPVGTNTASSAAIIGSVDFNGQLNTSNRITDFTDASNAPSSIVSVDGSQFWLNGAGGIRYSTAGNTTSTSIIATTGQVRDMKIADGQLYAAASPSPKMFKVGTGIPTSLQTLTGLPGLPLNIQGPGQFAFADLDIAVPGVDVLYVASPHTSANAAIGIRKFSLVNNSWVDNGSLGGSATNSYFLGLALKQNGNNVTLFATRQGLNNSIKGGELVKFIDNSGYNATITGTISVLSSITVANSMGYRGVSLVPVGCPVVKNLRVPDIASSQANVLWTAPDAATAYEYAVTTSPTAPLSGTTTNNTFLNLLNLTNATTYYVHVRNVCGATSASEWSTVSFTTGCNGISLPLTTIIADAAGTTTAKWNKVFGAQGYEYFLSQAASTPSAGTYTQDTSVVLQQLKAVTRYFLYIRSKCSDGSFSGWSFKEFTTGCFVPVSGITLSPNKAMVTWNKINNVAAYEYALTYTQAPPLSGIIITDTFFVNSKLSDGSPYFLHVRSRCSTGALSGWTTVNFKTQGLQVFPNPVYDFVNLKLNELPNASGTIVITDAAGRIHWKQKVSNSSTSIDVRSWNAGTYTVLYNDGKNSYPIRFVKF